MDSSKKAKWSWALYDWANSAFSTTVMAAFFPLFLKDYWSTNQSVTESTWYLACLLYTSPSPRDRTRSRMPSSA